MGRIRRSSRRASMKARLSIAAAVLVGGGAIGAVAVVASNHSAPQAASSAGFSWNNSHQQLSWSSALNTALTTNWRPTALVALQRMAPMHNFVIAQHGHTTFAAQRGVVLLANKHFLLVKSANGGLHLWLLSGATKVTNVVTNSAGLAAMTGTTPTAPVVTAAQQGNIAPVTQTMLGVTTQTVTAMTAPVVKPVTITVSVPGTNEVITISIAQSTATVTPSGQMAAVTTGVPMTTNVQPVMMTANAHIARGDLVFVAGVVKHHQLVAQLVLFKAPATAVTPTPTGAPTGTVVPTTGVTPTMPVVTATPSQVSGTHT